MSTDKASYLATHYLTADPPKSTSSSSSTKKRKRSSKSKPPTAQVNNLIIQDDEDTWAFQPPQNSEDEDGDIPLVIAGHSAEFRKAKKSAWSTVGTAVLPPPKPPQKDTTSNLADAILATAKSDAAALAHDSDDDSSSPESPKMSNGMKPGLQSAASITAQLAQKALEEKAELARLQQAMSESKQNNKHNNDDEDEVILRDATGRRIDVSMRRAQARRELQEKQRAEAEKQRLLKGDVQVQEAEKRRERLEEAKLMKLARGKDDEEINREQREEGRWNDPMAQFLTETDINKPGKGGKKKKGLKGRPVYNGPAEPNRYGIRPGYRWDGVDRGNGWEKERFRMLNKKEMNKGLEYAWQMDE
ncbi:putative Pre-mRNA-splicing factor cwc-26 [Triangularia verruculosa]|uniref:Pre-mRNA-splicing factor cwc-26 n=1 Tax=Triangularia verruculosa TaxID=2587418 RepID=A0AAN6XTA7_9PEZI|nr:putative Pre-mRNA-splicing factor cwc-26 [Triangularia verruculosa]